MSQLLAAAGPYLLESSWYDTDGVLDPDVDTVTIGVVDGNGDTVVAAGTATTDNTDGTYEYSLASVTNPDQLKVTWTDVSSGATLIQRVEVAGSLLFSLAQARAYGAKADATTAIKPLASTTEYTNDTNREERTRITDELETATGTGWIPD